MTHHSNISLAGLLETKPPIDRRSRRSALYWRSKGKVYLPICHTANPDGSCSSHPETEALGKPTPKESPMPLLPRPRGAGEGDGPMICQSCGLPVRTEPAYYVVLRRPRATPKAKPEIVLCQDCYLDKLRPIVEELL